MSKPCLPGCECSKEREEDKMNVSIPENELKCRCPVQRFLNILGPQRLICQNCGMKAKNEERIWPDRPPWVHHELSEGEPGTYSPFCPNPPGRHFAR
jgi:hypothetical protein